MDRGEVLDNARECVCKNRNDSYGEPEDNFRNIANLWNDYLLQKYDFKKITPVDIGILMALLKIARMAGKPNDDNYVDAIGYLACACEIDGKEATENAADDEVLENARNNADYIHKKSCIRCKHLYIKDMVTGVCDNPKSKAYVVQPDDVCDYWEPNKKAHTPTQAEKEEFFKDDISVALEYIASMGEL